jgi:N-acetylneuraminic acid mutarotase
MKKLTVLLMILFITGLVLVPLHGASIVWDFEDGLQGWTHTNGQSFPNGWARQPSNIHTPAPPDPGDWTLWINPGPGVGDTALSPKVATPLSLYLLKWGVAVQYDLFSIGIKHKTGGVWNTVVLKTYAFVGWDSVDVSPYWAAESIQVYVAFGTIYGGNWAGIDNIELRSLDQLQHDVGVFAVTSPPAGIVNPGDYDVIGRVCNYGANTESFDVTAIVYDTTAGWIPIFNQTLSLTDFVPLDDSLVNFGQVDFVEERFYQTVIFTQLVGDQEPSNDTAEVLSRAHRTILSIDPDTIIAPPPAPGETFTVSVIVSNVDSMSGWQFGMMFNPVLLQCLGVTEGPFLQQGGSTWWIAPNINNNAGWISPCCAVILGQGSVTGSGTIAYIQFQVVNRDSGGISILDFEDAMISHGIAPIPFEIINGYFLSQLPPPKDSSDFWTLKAPMPTERACLAVAAVDDKIYALGGGPNWTAGSQKNEEYDPYTDTWTTKAPMPTARACLAAAAVNGKVYAIGGYDSNDLSTNEKYDPVTDIWIPETPMPTPRRMFGADAVDGKIYAIGGYPNLTTNEEYDPQTNTWTPKAPMPTGRSCLAVVAFSGKIYAIGGHAGNTTVLATVEEYNPETDNWTTKTPMPAQRHLLTGAAVNGKIYVQGGSGQLDNYEYNPSADTTGGTPWVVKRGMSRPTSDAAAAAIPGLSRLFVFGGPGGGGGVLAHNHMYIPYSEIIGVKDNSQQSVDGAVALRVYPNPFSKKTDIRFSMLDAGYQITDDRLQIKIYDATGRLVKDLTQLLNYQLPNNQVVWSGDDNSGRKLPAGIYFVRLEASDYKVTKKVILLR